ncbi:hypothetical protein L228DRAFT_281285 [Xylona heveae TC161]|uniref:Uncharacterized protein n=1 Tax=Xylona heveae (strain CBS 132557 / TC161) TaxID=1328760 RepID=A0A165I0G1_XYLHT|nr:hypothetical protein L228DRAFT_281285 [Xylona heveae TC161]KZF24182.1 hypothetical protein L228DRAFT_281285 [Xylona heveae TC161]
MTLKRKRSSCSLSSPISTSSASSIGSIDGLFGFRQSSHSPVPGPTPAFAPIPFPQLVVPAPNTIIANPSSRPFPFFAAGGGGAAAATDGLRMNYAMDYSGARDLNSRTRKRFRDNRPHENVVHENTLQKLFAAQQHQPPHHHHHHHTAEHQMPPESSIPQPQPCQSSHNQHVVGRRKSPLQSSLHAFWSLPQARTTSSMVENPFRGPAAGFIRDLDTSRCEDCDAELSHVAGDMEYMEMMDTGASGYNSDDLRCRACGKLVCGTCAVLADVRVCLQCAMSG